MRTCYNMQNKVDVAILCIVSIWRRYVASMTALLPGVCTDGDLSCTDVDLCVSRPFGQTCDGVCQAMTRSVTCQPGSPYKQSSHGISVVGGRRIVRAFRYIYLALHWVTDAAQMREEQARLRSPLPAWRIYVFENRKNIWKKFRDLCTQRINGKKDR